MGFNPGRIRTVVSTLARVLALLVLFVCWAGMVDEAIVQAGRSAGRQTSLAAQGVAAGLNASFARFTEQALAVRPADLGPDRVAQTARLLRLQTLLPPGTATFSLGPDGQLLAASAPFTRQELNVADAPWVKRGIQSDSTTLLVQPLDRPWLGVTAGFVLLRTVVDANGRQAGLIGAVVPAEMLAPLLSPDWMPSGTSVALRLVPGGTMLAGPEPPAAPQALQTDLALAALRWSGERTQWSAAVPVRGWDAAIIATTMPAVALDHALSAWSTIISAAGLLLAWLLASATFFRPRTVVAAGETARFGWDWQCDLDASGVVDHAYGQLPDHLTRGDRLSVALGLADSSPEAERIDAAIASASALSLDVASSGRAWRIALEPSADGFTCTGRDVTAEAEARAALHAAEAAAADARREQERLLTSLGHDIRTPMASIIGICELLLDGELEQEQRDWLERVRASCGALLGMLNGLLDVAGTESGPGTVVREPVEIAALLQDVIGVLRPQARDKGLELRIRCDDLLRGQWLLDPARIRQVVFNLASNAVKFTDSGRVEIHASAVENNGEHRLRIAVSDTGPGIDPADREHVFERFNRGRTQQASGAGGLGLGLALCRENAELLGGTLSLVSALGVGSEFTFECPVQRAEVPDRLRPFAGRTALIVADDQPAMRAVGGLLGELGLTVETAADGYLGLALAERLEAQRGALDLVVLQARLPGMAGEVFVRRLRDTSFGRRAVLIWVGSDADAPDVDASVAPDMDPYQVAEVAKQLLSERPSFEVLEPNLKLARGGRVLLAEDDKANQKLLATALTRRGFAVFTAGDGEEAVRLAARDTFDAIVMDLQMPGMDGFEATRRIRSSGGRLGAMPIIALTALHGPGVRQRCLEAGFSSVMEKPVNMDRLAGFLRRNLSTRAASAPGQNDYVADVSMPFLEEMVAVVGLDRARACVTEFVTDATARCRRLGELLPGWEVGTILRSCEEISGMAETCGAIALGELLEEIADTATRDDRAAAAVLIERLETVVARLPGAMAACLDDVEQRWTRGKAA